MTVAIGIEGGETGFALRATASHSGDKGDGSVNTTLVAELSPTIRSNPRNNSNPITNCDMLVAHALRGEGFDASEDGTGRGTPLVPELAAPLTSKCYADNESQETKLIPEVSSSVTSKWSKSSGGPSGGPSGDECQNLTIAFPATMSGTQRAKSENISCSIGAANPTAIAGPAMAVRRLTPRECERLQGFPDDYTLITIRNKPAADGPRYKALGNSMAVPVIEWLLRRMDLVDELVPFETPSALSVSSVAKIPTPTQR